jgi:uncharacterized protein (TIGR02996 family)
LNTRRFEHAGRFWEATLAGRIVKLAWGAIGTAGQRIDRAFEGEQAAAAYVEHHAAQYVAKGYVEVVEAAPPPAAPRSRNQRFEVPQLGDTWFLEVVQIDTTVHYRSGRITGGADRVDRSDTTHFASQEAADRAYDERCAEAGYHGAAEISDDDRRSRAAVRETAVKARRHGAISSAIATELPPREDVAPHEELEAQCLASPDSPAPWEVYADWLESRGDPRAAIAARHRAGGRVDRLVREQLLGIADDDDVEEELRGASDHEIELDFELRFGFVRHASIKVKYDAGIELEVAVRRFLSAPVARFVDSLRFGLAAFEGDNDWAPVLRAVVESAQAPRMRALAFDDFTSEDSELSWVEYGDFSELLPRLPALEHLKIRSGGGGTLGRLVMPAMKSFVRESGGLKRTELVEICGAQWSNLEHLEIWTGATNYGAEASCDDFERVLAARDLPRLRHLGIVNSQLSDELVPVLARSRVLPQLESLDVSRGIGAEALADALVEHAAAFRHLAAIDLSGNFLDATQVGRIREVLDNVIVVGQRVVDEERYVAVGE